MNARCDGCGFEFQREPGYYLGAIYFNYGMTALITAIAYPVLVLSRILTANQSLAVCTVFVCLFPFFFFRYSRSLWLGFDQFVDPHPPDNSDTRRS